MTGQRDEDIIEVRCGRCLAVVTLTPREEAEEDGPFYRACLPASGLLAVAWDSPEWMAIALRWRRLSQIS